MSQPSRILLVEDSRTQALSLSHALEREGWSVDWAMTAEAALDRLNEGSPELIVLDYYLPGISGDELCRRIRMSLQARNIPILMLTMDQSHDAELNGLESGADDFLPKSVDSQVLLARVRALLNKSLPSCPIPVPVDQRFRRARLLTIDDSATFQEYLTAELEQEGYLIERAMSGREGLERILHEPFDCALVDLVMPDIDGIEVCRQARAACQAADHSLALLMLTGRENKEDLTQALEAGADDFVGKSSDMAVLKGRIRALLRRKFCQEDNRRVAEELKRKEVELLRARADRELAEARAALNIELEKRVEERTAQLEEANHSLGQQTRENEMFVYSVSHDLRSPLVNLQGFSKELERSSQELTALLMGDAVPDAVRRQAKAIIEGDMQQSLHFIQRVTIRLSNIIEALLRLSRVGRVEYSQRVLDMNALVNRVLESLSVELFDRQVEVRVADLPPSVGDPTAIEQLIANLVGNALKYLDPQRSGEIEIGVLEPTTEAPRSHTYFVKDNGLGIPFVCRDKIFQAFQRAHPDVAPGEGMGLAIVRRIVERHGGRVWVESTEGQGSTFLFDLRSSASAEGEASSAAVAITRDSSRIH
jgi:two-component system NtrC family sensor kinase